MEDLKRLLMSFGEQTYNTIALFDQNQIIYTIGESIFFENFRELWEQGNNQPLNGFDLPARVSFHGNYGLLWIAKSFDEGYPIHLKMVDLHLENERLQKLQHFYDHLIREIGRVSDTGILVVNENGQLLYENDASQQIDLKMTVADLAKIEEPAPMKFDEMIREYPSHKIYRRGLPDQKNTLIFSKMLQGEVQKTQAYESTASLERKIIGQTSAMEEIMNTINKVAPTDSTVLIRGESGTGKEGFAKLIHNKSPRNNKPFIAINCASIPEDLLESELFGYAKGSFTGALKGGKTGKFEAANKGTIFLDEIGDMSMNLQAKLLRVLEEKTIEKVGGNRSIKVDVRIISATHQNLETMILKKQFRKDLFYRLNVIPIPIPALRDRAEDIENLVHYYIKKHSIVNSRSFMRPSVEVIEKMKAYNWPGNIRELINVVEYIVSTEDGEIITEKMLPREILNMKRREKQDGKLVQAIEETVKRHVVPSENHQRQLVKKSNEKPRKPNRKELLKLLDEFGYSSENKKELAKHLGISPATLYRWLKKNEIT
jgi:DNA-binding NtrC family response regulator